jgi:hypothetical protein
VRLRGKDSNVLYIQTRTSTPPPRSLILTKPACPKPSAFPISTCTHPSNPNSPKIAQKSDRASGSVNQPMANPHPATSNHTHAGYIWGLCESGAIAMSGWRAFRDLYAPSVERLLYRTVEKAALFSTSHTSRLLLLFTGHEPSFAISVFGVAFNGSSSLLFSYDFEHYGEPSAQITQENLFTEHLFRISDSDSFRPLGKHIINLRPTITSTDHHTTSS